MWKSTECSIFTPLSSGAAQKLGPTYMCSLSATHASVMVIRTISSIVFVMDYGNKSEISAYSSLLFTTCCNYCVKLHYKVLERLFLSWFFKS